MPLVFATHNHHKLTEVKAILPQFIESLSLNDINCHEDIAETANSIEGNAQLKARYVFKNYNLPCFADDTGLFVNALNGEPGVYSARYAGGQKNAQANIQKLMQNLNHVQDRSAYFKTVIAFKTQNEEKIFTGICKGEITKTPSGKSGFGYDPIFKPQGYTETFAALDANTKNQISHRSLALQKFIDYLK
ncbi:non-canonical purine NTP diphosphatase [Flavobacterium sp. CS20]|uniref:non-canonical purine NTP diphosphatase n=1 Tax=Flavobacterium sp. CS20 TaxID=2775246 RepID=UPI001B39F9C0|nr:non-canonical purine NTP diphosphatase [Flavobacterium sp. CS20]QTY27219.1 non-canonical purine NTP diphosphatase [Flavobacterium sp. CS20]